MAPASKTRKPLLSKQCSWAAWQLTEPQSLTDSDKLEACSSCVHGFDSKSQLLLGLQLLSLEVKQVLSGSPSGRRTTFGSLSGDPLLGGSFKCAVYPFELLDCEKSTNQADARQGCPAGKSSLAIAQKVPVCQADKPSQQSHTRSQAPPEPCTGLEWPTRCSQRLAELLRERELNSVHAANRADEMQWIVHVRVSSILSRSCNKQEATSF